MTALYQEMPHCQMWWAEGGHDETEHEHVCMRAPSYHRRHVCTCGAEMIEDAS